MKDILRLHNKSMYHTKNETYHGKKKNNGNKFNERCMTITNFLNFTESTIGNHKFMYTNSFKKMHEINEKKKSQNESNFVNDIKKKILRKYLLHEESAFGYRRSATFSF